MNRWGGELDGAIRGPFLKERLLKRLVKRLVKKDVSAYIVERPEHKHRLAPDVAFKDISGHLRAWRSSCWVEGQRRGQAMGAGDGGR